MENEKSLLELQRQELILRRALIKAKERKLGSTAIRALERMIVQTVHQINSWGAETGKQYRIM